ncbi:MAG: alanine racemase [Alphaproteobacteria bacterium]
MRPVSLPSSPVDALDQVPLTATSVYEIDLDALAHNYRFLQDKVGACVCSAVVKADAYGLGVEPVARKLAEAGAKEFFVATLEEGIQLRGILPFVTIYVLNGLWPGTEPVFDQHRLVPVLADLGQVALWKHYATQKEKHLGAILQVDTGLVRLGLSFEELGLQLQERDGFAGLHLHYVMSHLACAYQPGHPYNQQQRAIFEAVRALLPGVPGSFAGSGGIFHGPGYWFDMVRPGRLLYGSSFTAEEVFQAAVQPVITLRSRVLQLQTVQKGQSVGYDQTYWVERPMRLATISMGYADGYMRSLGNRGMAMVNGREVPVVGRISMDLATLDVTDLPDEWVYPGSWVDLINQHITVDTVAAAAGTVSWEILTRLGKRPHKIYFGGAA